jgi:hypothetical protein
MFHYYAQRAFAPVLASPYKDMNGDIVVEVISDAREDLIGVMRVRVVRADSLTPLIDENVPVLAVCEIIMRIHFPVARPSYIWTIKELIIHPSDFPHIDGSPPNQC